MRIVFSFANVCCQRKENWFLITTIKLFLSYVLILVTLLLCCNTHCGLISKYMVLHMRTETNRKRFFLLYEINIYNLQINLRLLIYTLHWCRDINLLYKSSVCLKHSIDFGFKCKFYYVTREISRMLKLLNAFANYSY